MSENTAAHSFGELAIQKGYASRDQVEHCLQVLRDAQGTRPRLGQLMVQLGILTKEQVRDLLSMQSKELFLCSTCTKRYNVVFWNSGKTVTCPACRTALIRLTHLKGIVADETILCEE